MNNNNFEGDFFNFERIGLWLKHEADKKIYDFLEGYLENNTTIPVEKQIIEIINVVSDFYLTTNIELLKLYNQQLLKFITNSQGKKDTMQEIFERLQ